MIESKKKAKKKRKVLNIKNMYETQKAITVQ